MCQRAGLWCSSTVAFLYETNSEAKMVDKFIKSHFSSACVSPPKYATLLCAKFSCPRQNCFHSHTPKEESAGWIPGAIDAKEIFSRVYSILAMLHPKISAPHKLSLSPSMFSSFLPYQSLFSAPNTLSLSPSMFSSFITYQNPFSWTSSSSGFLLNFFKNYT